MQSPVSQTHSAHSESSQSKSTKLKGWSLSLLYICYVLGQISRHFSTHAVVVTTVYRATHTISFCTAERSRITPGVCKKMKKNTVSGNKWYEEN